MKDTNWSGGRLSGILTKNHNDGFGVLELMVAILLGSMVVLLMVQSDAIAAKYGIQGRQSAVMIDEMTGVLPSIKSQLALAGIGRNPSVSMAYQPLGVVILPTQIERLQTGGNVSLLASLIQTGNSPSTTTLPSDQLTIGYVAPMDMWDCEGRLVEGPKWIRLATGELIKTDGQGVLERYFVHAENGELHLRCNASKFAVQNPFAPAADKKFTLIDGGRGKGSMVLDRIGGFWIRLFVETEQGVQIMTQSEYRKQYANNPKPIRAISVAILYQGGIWHNQDGKMMMFGRTVGMPDGQRVQGRLLSFDVVLHNAGVLQ